MATSEHVLKLKAVLDTTEMQAQINSIQAGSGGNTSFSQVSPNMDKLNKSLGDLSKSTKGASDSMQKMIRVGALLGIGRQAESFVRQSEWVEEDDLSTFKKGLSGAGLGAAIGFIGGPIAILAGALIGAIVGVLVDLLPNIVNSSMFSDLINSTQTDIPVIGKSLSGMLDKFKEFVNTYSNEAKKKIDEQNKELDELLKRNDAAKKGYEKAKEDVDQAKVIREMSKYSNSQLQDYVANAYKSRKAYEDLFDPSSDAYQEIQKNSKNGSFYTDMAIAMEKAKKQMDKDIQIAQSASKEVEDRYEKEWENQFGPMTNFAKMGMNFGEVDIQQREVNLQEQELDVVRRIYDKMSRSESTSAVFN